MNNQEAGESVPLEQVSNVKKWSKKLLLVNAYMGGAMLVVVSFLGSAMGVLLTGSLWAVPIMMAVVVLFGAVMLMVPVGAAWLLHRRGWFRASIVVSVFSLCYISFGGFLFTHFKKQTTRRQQIPVGAGDSAIDKGR